MVPKTFIFFAVSCVSAVASANNLFSGLDTVLTQGNGNYIIQLNQTICIKHFVPRFIDNAFDIFSHTLGADKIEKRSNRIVRRDTDLDQVHVFDAYDIGGSFKGITVQFEDLHIVRSLLTSFNSEILKIIPDMDVEFDLPTNKKSELLKRYYLRQVKNHKSERAGNFDFDHYEHDENCPYAHDKRAKTTTTKKASCTAGSLGKKKSDGYWGYCCSSQSDCRNKCVSGKCNGPAKPKTTTTKKAATTKKTTTKKTTNTKATKTTTANSPAPTNDSTCLPGSFGNSLGNGFNGYCCDTQADCLDNCVSGKCNGPENEDTPSTTSTANSFATTTKQVAESTTTALPTPVNTASYAKQTGAEWNLVRVSQRSLDLKKPYIYDSDAASDIYVYVLDDGMNIGHKDFGGRAKWGFSAYKDISKLGEGHGTHVAGIIGGNTYGVAKKVNIVAVQVLNEEGNGAISSLLAGLQWAANDAKKHKGKAIINMSLGLRTGGGSSSTYKAFNEVISSVVNSGIPLFAAAGNWASDTCDVLPAGNKDVFAVAATDNTDTMAWYSGYGKCVDIFAPGSDILSTYITSSSSTTTLSGTSMASPHVAGVAALLMGSMENPTSVEVYDKVKSIATSNVVKDAIKNTPNTFLFNGQQLTEKI
ncbi:hypothetical protein INT48_000833 [Thamnidium elegans]|uniref:Peptidase S8/S53 domain-containing protein n=1 Tax=Thamnidium elegans TaxID=101142 RepID=A0A8H7SYL9_9FUNG|nr:hypothetical protein INT48_000833 [Thamnidium elegans]